MKKLFVLFLLAVLVPFSIGCFSDSDDATVAAKIVTAKAILPAALSPNIRAVIASGQPFYGFKLIKNGVTLTADTAVLNADGTYTVTFVSAALTDAEYSSAVNPVYTIKITDGANVTKVAEAYINTTSMTGDVVITITGTSVTGVTVGTTAVPAEQIGSGKFSIVAVKSGSNALSTTSGSPTVVNSLTPAFEIELSEDIAITNGALPTGTTISITTKNAAGTSVAASISDFTLAQVLDSTKKFTVTVKDLAEPKKLQNGSTYTVVINNFKHNSKITDPATYYFKVTL